MIQGSKKRVFWTFGRWIDLILHMMIALHVFQHLAPLPRHGGSFKCVKKAFLNGPKCQKGYFWTSVSWIDLLMHMMIELYVFQNFATLPGHDGF